MSLERKLEMIGPAKSHPYPGAVDDDALRILLEKVAEDDARVGFVDPSQRPVDTAGLLKVAWLCAKNPFLGGEYYRATRPAALTSREFDWHTAVCDRMATSEDPTEKRLAFLTPGPDPHAMVPDVIILRPIRDWTREFTDQARAAGQIVLLDLDDDVWHHEDWTVEERPTEDNFEEWCFDVDGVLVSTEHLADVFRRQLKMHGRDVKRVPVLVAPNCYDPIGIGRESHPVAGRRMGTRLWLSGRMSSDFEIYENCFAPLISELDMEFVHIGYEPNVSGKAGEGAHGITSFAQMGVPEDRLVTLPSMNLLEMGKWLGATMSIGAIAMADVAFNRAKTETHAVELAAAGLPLVAATTLRHYEEVPGVVAPDPEKVRLEVMALTTNRTYWGTRSREAREWALDVSMWAEQLYLGTVESLVKELVKR